MLRLASVFLTVLVHEYGHGLMAKSFHCSPSIILWGGGGLCYSEMERQTPQQRLAVVLMGPGAGFLLCGVVMLVVTTVFGVTPREHLSVVERLLGLPEDRQDYFLTLLKLRTDTNSLVYRNLVWINLMWGLVNLLPVWPLDGGRISEILFSYFNPSQGARRAHILSLLVAGVLAFLAYTWTGDLFLTVFFAYFALVNFQILQSIHQKQMMGLYQDEDWWRR
jgi:Zn-dependent protease